MTNTYSTGNALGSTAPKDLFDNASNFDDAMNSPSPSFYDRFNKRRETWAGMEKAFDDFLIASGPIFLGDYDADGPLTITQPNEVFTKDGNYFRAGPALVLPYTTVNNWVIDEPKFTLAGDNVIRSDLASTDGALGVSLVAGASRTVNSVADLLALPQPWVLPVFTLGYYAPGDGGGAGPFYWDSISTEPANGGTIFGTGTGRAKLSFAGELNVKIFGAKGDGVTNDNAAINAAVASLATTGGVLFFPKGVYIATGVNWTIATSSFYANRIGMRGEGPSLSVIKAATVATDASLVSVTADTATAVNSLIFGTSFSNMGFEVGSVTGNTFKAVNCAYMKFDNCYFSGGNRTFSSEGCLSSSFVNCKFAYGRYGFYALPGFSYPNQLSFFQCVITANTVGGLYAKNPGGIRFYGGSIENNGAGNASGFGAIIDHASATSSGTPIGCVFNGTYFEFNNGLYDVYISHNNAFENLSFSIVDCSFACGGSAIVTDRVKIEHLSATAITGHVDGCNFSELSGFAPTTGQKYINVTGAGAGARKIYANENYYNAANSTPVAGAVLSYPASLSSRVESYSGTTNASGILTVSTSGFSSTPSVSVCVTDGTGGVVYSARRTSASSVSSTFEVMQQAVAGGAWSAAGTVSVTVVAVGT